MAHFCGFTKLIFLLLMLVLITLNESRPLKENVQGNSDVIAGNEFLQLFMERAQLDKDLYSNEYVTKKEDTFDKKSAETGIRSSGGRSLKDKTPLQNQAEGQLADSKQVVKLVTSGSKIVFLEDYDENDAILDAEVRDIDLKRDKLKNKFHSNLDDYKVVAVSVSSSSQRGTKIVENHSKLLSTTTKRPLTTTKAKTTKIPLRVASRKTDSVAGDNFINRSHKSEFSIEEVEPLTTAQHRGRTIHRRQQSPFRTATVADTLEAVDSENSASTNIHNILAVPLQQAASARSTSTVTSTFNSNQRNMTINHNSNVHDHKTDANNSNDSETQHMISGVEDQLLPFQTVIYHDTKGGHGPQSRSISYSSISQNVEDLKKWQHSGILAEARRNVSESLKPMSRSNISTFYSQSAKLYSEPSKFYSEPAKVYSEPAKVYGEPSKFYSEPSKVYSQPSKVYSEPAKTYWPLMATTTAESNSATTEIPQTNAPFITTTMLPMVNILHQASRKPAIVSRIAFGEAHSTTTTTSSSSTAISTTSSPLTTTTLRTYGTHSQHQYTRSYSSHRNPSHSSFNNENSSLSSSLSSSMPSRRILFNLDRLPYDLLNAPESSIQQQQQQLLQQQKIKRPQQTLTYNQQQQKQPHNINPCLESAVSSLFSSSSLSAHPAIVKQRQHSDSQQQHSNQNAKGLPNGDLVRCVAAIPHTSSAVADDGNDGKFTTERTNMEEHFKPTPEQNYEREESVNVATNGRAHGGGIHGGDNSFTQPTTSPLQHQQHHSFKPNRQRTRIHFGTNIDNQKQEEVQQHQLHHQQISQLQYNANANANVETSNKHSSHAPDYNDNVSDEVEERDGSLKNNDYEGDDGANNRGFSSGNGNNGDDEDSKVAYVVEGRNYRKYRVEEKTDDGFIVGEYGVVDHNDGNLRGVRYTADSTINPSLIQKALLTFLKLK